MEMVQGMRVRYTGGQTGVNPGRFGKVVGKEMVVVDIYDDAPHRIADLFCGASGRGYLAGEPRWPDFEEVES